MKKKIYLALFLSFFIIISISICTVYHVFKTLKKELAEKYYQDTIQTYEFILRKEKTLLKSIAQYLSKSPSTKEAYLKNNKSYIIKEFTPLYQALYNNHLLDEMHFFKTPVKNFVSFSNLNLPEINLTKARRDVLWVTTSLKPSVHFFICRHFPGLRATYPIIFDYKIYGSVSVGINLVNLKNMLEDLNMKTSLYLNDKLLKDSLCPSRYLVYKKYPLYKGYRVIGPLYKIDFHKHYEIKDDSIYVIIPIKDFFKHTAAYLIVKRNFADVFNIIKLNAREKIISEIIIYILIFSLFFILFRYIYKRFNELQNILNLIKNKEFEKLPKKVKEKDEFDKFKNNLIDVAKNLSLYIKLITNEKEHFSKKAYEDTLTNVYNRNFLEEKAEDITEKIKLKKEPLGIIIFDIDNFKQINDIYGHDIGDLVLSEVAQNVKKVLRKDDIFIRYGGEEFVILLPNTSFKNTIKIAEKIRKTVENLNIPTPKNTLKVTISVGVSEFYPADKSIFEAIKRADIKLYKAKTSGKNKVIY